MGIQRTVVSGLLLAFLLSSFFPATPSSASPPTVPQNLAPPDGAVAVTVNPTLRWSSVDNDIVSYDVYFGTDVSPPFVVNTISTGYNPAQLHVNTTYYWRIVVHDGEGFQVSGPVWSFTTRTTNSPPNPPASPDPQDLATNVSNSKFLTWLGSDPDSDRLSYDIYFGNASPPPLVASNWGSTTYIVFNLQVRAWYYWRIVAHDGQGEETSGAEWRFYTGASATNNPPEIPSNPVPADNGVVSGNTVTLQWTCSDPDGQAFGYSVFVGTSNSLFPFLFHGSGGSSGGTISFTIDDWDATGTFYWQVSASDGIFSTTSPVWKFTKTAPLPVAFTKFNARAGDEGGLISWEIHTNETMESYTVYRATGSPAQPVVVGSGNVNGTTGTYLDRSAKPEQTYVYSMMVRTSGGDEYRSPNATVVMPAMALSLEPNRPNPFNPQTTIPYTVPSGARARVRLVIYDTAGRLVRVLANEEQAPGRREVVWRGDDESGATVSSGIYFCVLKVGNEQRTKKLVLLK